MLKQLAIHFPSILCSVFFSLYDWWCLFSTNKYWDISKQIKNYNIFGFCLQAIYTSCYLFQFSLFFRDSFHFFPFRSINHLSFHIENLQMWNSVILLYLFFMIFFRGDLYKLNNNKRMYINLFFPWYMPEMVFELSKIYCIKPNNKKICFSGFFFI